MKFSVAQMLYGMIVFALIAAVIGAGANGSPLAYGVGVSVCMLFVYFGLFAMLHWGTIMLAGGRRQPIRKAPVKVEEETEA